MEFDSITLVALASIIGTFLTSWFFFIKRARDARTLDLETRLIKAEKELAVLGVSVSIAFQAKLAEDLTHLHTPEMDSLLRKLWPYRLNPSEKERLLVLLKARAIELDQEIDQHEKEAAIMLPFVINRIEKEAKEIK